MPSPKPAPTAAQIAKFGPIAARLRQALEAKGWTPSDLRERLKLGPNNPVVYVWLASKGAPGPKHRKPLGKLLGIPEEALIASDSVPVTRAKYGSRVIAPAALSPMPGPVYGTKQGEVLAFNVLSDGRARLRLDVTLPIERATPLLRMLLDQSLIMTQSDSIAAITEEG